MGRSVALPEVWPAISRVGWRGRLCAETFLLAQDALRRGLASLILQARDPWAVLTRCQQRSIRAILNHRLAPDSRAGHYAVLVDLDDASVVLHDPQWGPSKRRTREELLSLWRAMGPGCEITGNVLVAIAEPDATAAATCPRCGTQIRRHVVCRVCKREIPLNPAGVLGCEITACPGRIWQCIFCPYCDEKIRDMG
jgi:hypothetical protein